MSHPAFAPIKATYSSTVFETEDEYFETVSIDLERPNLSRERPALILLRRIEKQCIGYDEDEVFMVTPDEWSYFHEHHYEMHNITRQQITQKLNQITTWAVQNFNVDDVGGRATSCVLIRNEKKIPFNTEYSTDNLLHNDSMQKFEAILHESFGRHRTYNIMQFFRKHYPELPMTKIERLKPRVPTVAAELTYTTWGVWS